MKPTSNLKKDLIFCFLLTIIVVLFLNRGVRMQGIFFGADEIASDLLHFSYPYREFWADDYLKKGKIPLWNPYLESGLPFLAEAQTGIFYPTANILYYFFPPPVAFNWLIISSFIIIALGVYFFARSLGLTPIFAFFSAAVFTLSGFMVGHLRHVPIITATAFMPWMFLAAEKMIVGKRKSLWFIFLALFTAFSLFAGHLTTTYLIFLILTFYVLIRLWDVFRAQKKESLQPIILFFGALIFGVLLAAIQLVPSLELVKYSTRVDVAGDLERLWGASYLWKYVLLFINPFVMGDPSRGTWDIFQRGNYWENIGYLGILPLLLILLALFMRFKKYQAASAIKLCLILSAILTLGLLTPLYKLFLDWVPGFSFTRIPGRFLLFVDFFGAILAGFALESIFSRFTGRKQTLAAGIVIFLAVFDLFYFLYPFNTVMPLSYLTKPESAKYIEKDPDLFRVSSPDLDTWGQTWQREHGWQGDLSLYIAQREILPPDYNLLFRIPSAAIVYEITGHFSVKRSGDLDWFVSQPFYNLAPKDARLAKLLGMENIKYVVDDTPYENVPDLVEIRKFETNPKGLTIHIYRNDKWLPRAYIVGNARTFTDARQLMRSLTANDFDPAKEVFLETSESFPFSEGKGKVEIAEYRDTRVVLNAFLKDDGFLVLSDTYYPGWKAFVDGKGTKIYQANYAYRAVRVPRGQHEVIFSYDPASYKIGKYISLGSFAFLIGVGGFLVLKRNGTKKSF